jgi:aspartyl-tRNA(Asn)/glutamyl-tRNA(Gln) amidotransferase subunit B
MEEGSLRIDANVSVRRPGEGLGTRAEIKNLNSVRSLQRAVEYEARRQAALIGAGEAVVQETRHWNEGEGRTSSMRSKEEAYDYRYFPEPDLVLLAPPAEWQADTAAALPPLPADRRAALAAATGVAATDGAVGTVVQHGLDGLVVGAVDAGADGRLALNRAANELVNRAAPEVAAFAAVVRMEAAGRLTATQAKAVLGELAGEGGDPEQIAARLGFGGLGADEVVAAVDRAVADHPGEWARLAAGEAKLTGFFVGKVMAATRGQADGKAVTALLRARTERREP